MKAADGIGRALIGVRRPKMKGRGRDFESEPDERHHDSGREQGLDRTGVKFLPDRSEAGRARTFRKRSSCQKA